jgi:hypothetical protein
VNINSFPPPYFTFYRHILAQISSVEACEEQAQECARSLWSVRLPSQGQLSTEEAYQLQA